jgi:hypothetical protein
VAKIGARLRGGYDLLVSTGAQRATQTLACFLAALGERVAGGVVVEAGLPSGEKIAGAKRTKAGSGEKLAYRAEPRPAHFGSSSRSRFRPSMANGSLTSSLARRLTVSAVASPEASGRRDSRREGIGLLEPPSPANPKAQRA